jgi:hypothetical protein
MQCTHQKNIVTRITIGFVLLATFSLGVLVGTYKHQLKNFVLRRTDSPTALTTQSISVPDIKTDVRPVNDVNLSPSTPSENDQANKIKEGVSTTPSVEQTTTPKQTQKASVTITNARVVDTNVIVSTLLNFVDEGDKCDLDIFFSDNLLYKTYTGKVVRQPGGIFSCDGFNVPFLTSDVYKSGKWRFTVSVWNSYGLSEPVSTFLDIGTQ